MIKSTEGAAWRAVLDSNAVDGIADPPARYDAIQAAVADGRLELLWTHITVDELSAIEEPAKRARLLTIAAGVCRLVPTGTAVLDFSRWNFARFGSEDPEAIEAFRQGNLRHTMDALIASTAEYEACPLVTEDVRLTKRAQARGVDVWKPADLAARLGCP
jgi:predicted nucleic acid-binding protein